MSPQEFKAWFEGYSENMKGTPTKKQWERIKEKIELISDVQIVIDRRPSWYPIWYNTPALSSGFVYNSAGDYKLYQNEFKTETPKDINTTSFKVTCDSTQFLLENAKEIGRQEFVQ